MPVDHDERPKRKGNLFLITVVGSVNMDMIVRVPHLPAAGETVLATGRSHAPGGKGANQAVAAARAGSEALLVARVGDDPHGREVFESIRSAGVLTSHLIIDRDGATGTAVVAVDDTGGNSIVVVPGANGRVSREDIDRASDRIKSSAVLVLQLEIPLEAVAHSAQIAHSAGSRVILNPAPVQSLDPSLLETVDILVANADEVAVLSGLGWPVDPASAARLLLGAGAKCIIVTLGAEGAVVVTAKEERDIPAFPVAAVDSTGAGDAFVGNLAGALDMGQTVEDAVVFASAAAALSVGQLGAQPSMPARSMTEELMMTCRT